MIQQMLQNPMVTLLRSLESWLIEILHRPLIFVQRWGFPHPRGPPNSSLSPSQRSPATGNNERADEGGRLRGGGGGCGKKNWTGEWAPGSLAILSLCHLFRDRIAFVFLMSNCFNNGHDNDDEHETNKFPEMMRFCFTFGGSFRDLTVGVGTKGQPAIGVDSWSKGKCIQG